MMEVPGLLEGAHRGVGLGHQFLRHAERTRIYVHLIDGLSEDPVADYHMLTNELQEFNPALAGKRQIIAVNKLDVTEVKELRDEIALSLREAVGDPAVPITFISAATGEGVPELLGTMVEYLAAAKTEESETALEEGRFRKPAPRSMPERVYKYQGLYVVESEELERLVALADLRDQRVILQLWREMTRRGLARKLADLEIEAGDTIRIGQFEVEWF
jgi:GTP-binding protein